ncbi:citrate-binding protein-like [Phragmites australis]|uniref:citrate-binding protein-like n=1 Tax=Phragmites australis TaxID=29695 RepID=UPI002D792C0A|nr:citrate-binding protein-like [Phragmites australis]
MARSMSPLLLLASTLLLLLLSSSCTVRSARGEGQLTDGFTAVELAEAQFKVQKPYDVPLAERYELVDGVRRMWVYATDKPISSDHPGGPRTEIKIELIYSSGVWQFEGYGYIPCGTSGASVMQIFGAAEHATTLMLHVYDGQLTYYHDDTRVVDAGVYDRWFRLNVVHDVAASNITVFVDGEHRLTVPGRGGDSHYFKFGVYGQTKNSPSYRMESRWRDVKVFTKC